MDAALSVVQSWLALGDSGKYAESWDEAAQVLKSPIKRDEWVKKLNWIRPPLGKTKSRVLNDSVSFAQSLPGSPESEYLIIRDDTNCKRARSSSETVTPTKKRWAMANLRIFHRQAIKKADTSQFLLKAAGESIADDLCAIGA
jgi:hypothetical protein